MSDRKWNLQDIRPPEGERRRSRVRAEGERQTRQDVAPRRPRRDEPQSDGPGTVFDRVDVIDGKTRKRKRLILAVVIGIIIVGAGFMFSVLLSGAEVTLYPKYKNVTVQATFTAKQTAGSGELAYELLVLEADGERQVSATGKETASEQARGSIMIYNAFSENPVRLVKNTRFESPEGLIFKIEESAVVPGYTVSDGEIVPGVTIANVFADGPGEQYNISPSRFTVPGFEGDPEFEKIYGESTDAMSGGFEGERYIIEESELETAKQALHGELRNALIERLKNEQPAGFIVFDDAVTFAFDTLPATEYSDGLATIKERARLQVPIFSEVDFAEFIASHTVPGYEEESVRIEDPYVLVFSYPDVKTTTADISVLTEIEFDLSGNARIVWTFDEEKLKRDLAGVSKKTGIPNVLSGYPAIERAEAVVRPFWTQTLPEQTDKITLTTRIGDRNE